MRGGRSMGRDPRGSGEAGVSAILRGFPAIVRAVQIRPTSERVGCRFLSPQVALELRPPASRSAFEDVGVVEEAVKRSPDGLGRILAWASC